MGDRLNQLDSMGKLTANKRYGLLVDGIRVFWSSPIWGVGIGQFGIVSGDFAYTHSDYLEVAVSTGLIGLALYLGVYILLLLRVLKLRKTLPGRHMKYEMSYLLIVILVTRTIALIMVNYNDMYTYTLVGCYIGHTLRLSYLLRCENEKKTAESGKSDEVAAVDISPRLPLVSGAN